MTELDRALAQRKLATIARDLADLRHVAGLSLTEFLSDRFRQKGTERLLQEVVEAAVDLNQHLLLDATGAAAPNYYDSFVLLGEHGIIPRDLAAFLAPSAGLRNRLVHEYDKVDDALVLAAVGVAIDQFGR